jgi:hypothetical protein
MVICGSYMFEFSVSKDMRKEDIIREVAGRGTFMSNKNCQKTET